MDTTSVAPERTEERDRGSEAVEERDRLYDVLSALPFEERIATIERMAERMGV
jgi:hypothetical protein